MTAAPSRLALATIAALGLINLGRGGIHLFAPDGGAVSIAGLDVTPAPQTILFLFGSLGVGQIALGLVDMAAAWRWRSFVRPLLAIHLVQLALAVVALFAIKGMSTAEIAALRSTSEGTVKAQTNAIYRKAGVSGRSQLLSLFIDDLMRDDAGIRPQA